MLELAHLRKSFGDVVALDDVSIGVPEGRIVGFVGRNGAGKTTAMRIALGVLLADGGQVRWRGEVVDAVARRRFGYMPEERGLYPKMRVHEQLVYLARLHGLTKEDGAARADALFERLGVAGKLSDRVEALSLGNQQRVQLAAALVHRPEVVVLDEPFSGLDPTGVDLLAGVLAEEARRDGAAVLFSSHQLELVERLCDEVVLIERGRVVAAGTIEDLRASRTQRLLQIEVVGASESWFEVVPGVRLAERANGSDVLALDDDADPQRVLDVARAQGEVRRFAPVAQTLAELFRAVVEEQDEEHDEVAS